MKRIGVIGSRLVASSLAAVALAASASAGALPVNYDFSVTATDGPSSGITANGSFAFDSGIVPVGGGPVLGLGLFSNLAFTWTDRAYTAANVNTGELGFDENGALVGEIFGTTCNAGGCSVTGGNEQFYVADGAFYYGTLSDFEVYHATVRIVPAVPEPSSFALVCLGAAGLAGYQWRKMKGSTAKSVVGGEGFEPPTPTV